VVTGNRIGNGCATVSGGGAGCCMVEVIVIGCVIDWAGAIGSWLLISNGFAVFCCPAS
jgi:hypothetical protein